MIDGMEDETIGKDDETLLTELAADPGENNAFSSDEACGERSDEDIPDPTAEYKNRIAELENMLADAEKERKRRERELLCLGLLGDAGLPCELAPAVMASDDMAGTVELIRGAVSGMVEAEILRRCRSYAPLTGSRAPLTKEELIRMPVAELQRIKNMGAKLGY